jgi:hypothetical protein
MNIRNPRLNFALRYAGECHVPVFPVYGISDGKCDCGQPDCKSPGKHPLTANGFRDASTDEAQTRVWWGRWPNANIGMPTGAVSGYFVLDVDLPDGPASLEALIKQHGGLPGCARSITGSGGEQYFFANPAEPEIRNSAGALGPNLDVRGDGGYVVLPPSLHASGRKYRWLDAQHTMRALGSVDAPAWLIERAAKPASSKRPDNGAPGEGIREGERNDQLYRLARSLRAKRHSKDAVLRMLQTANALECLPPLSAGEIEAIVANAFKQPDREGFNPQDSAGGGTPVLIRIADVAPESVRWLWQNRIAFGKLNLIAGDPGIGKSFITLDLAARASTGRAFPDNAPGCEPCSVVLLSAEDGVADTIRPRLEAAGANLGLISILLAKKIGEKESPISSLSADLKVLESAVDQTGARLVIVDPISAYMGDADSHKNADVRAVLAPLAALAEQKSAALVGVTHLGKGENSALYRVLGSIAFTAAARVLHGAAELQDGSGRRVFGPLKSNLSVLPKALAFQLDRGALKWEGLLDIDARSLLEPASPGKRGRKPDKLEAVKQALAEVLTDGQEHPSADVMRRVRERMGDVSDALIYKARRESGVASRKDGFAAGGWVWQLPSPGNCEPSVNHHSEKDSSEDSRNAENEEPEWIE